MGLVTMEANYFYPYHRSQKTSALQKDSGLYAANCGMSLQGLSAALRELRLVQIKLFINNYEFMNLK